MVVGLALEFTFCNSLLEELFWRVFLYRELGGVAGVAHGAAGGAPLSAQGGVRAHTYGGDDCEAALSEGMFPGGGASADKIGGGGSELSSSGGKALGCLPAAETPKVLISCYYASYHFVVMLCFVPWYLAIAGFLGLVVLGRILVFCREDEVRARLLRCLRSASARCFGWPPAHALPHQHLSLSHSLSLPGPLGSLAPNRADDTPRTLASPLPCFCCRSASAS